MKQQLLGHPEMFQTVLAFEIFGMIFFIPAIVVQTKIWKICHQTGAACFLGYEEQIVPIFWA